MLVDMINGTTSFRMLKLIKDVMLKENISDDYMLVSKYYSCHNGYINGKKPKFIYLAYDAGSFVQEGKCHLEIEHFERDEPPTIIIVFTKNAYDWYKKHGYEVYLMPMGYDDLNYKEYNNERIYDVVSVCSLDKERWSKFYPRYLLGWYIRHLLNPKTNTVLRTIFGGCGKKDYDYINELYSKTKVGWNDIVFESPNMRCYEIPSQGAVMLANNCIDGFDYQLKEGKHFLKYDNILDMTNKLFDILTNDEKRIKMGKSAKKEILKYPFSKEVVKFVDKYGLR